LRISEIYIRHNANGIEMINKSISYFLIVLFVLAGCQAGNKKKSDKEESITVIVSPAKKIFSQKVISLSGNIEGDRTVRLGFMVSGKIDFIAVNEGENVRKGMLLSSLDPANYSIARELADIAVNQVQDEYDRLKMMHDSNSLSESDFAKITFGLQQAKVQQKLHTKNLSDTKLYSPIDGVLLRKLAETGEIIAAGMPLFAVSDIRKVKVSAFVPENELHDIRIRQSAQVFISSLSRTFEGKVIELASAADPASRSFQVRIEVDNPELMIRPGMIAQVKITSGTGSELLSIPVEALQHDFNDQTFVYVVDTVQNKAFRSNVSTGKLVNEYIEILSGLKEHEAVVTGGQQKLVNGSKVTIVK
jgi:RND family efflux transporter MFP subunit